MVEENENTTEETPVAIPKAKPSKTKYVGKEVKILQPSGAKFLGLCVSERKTNSGSQVFLKLNGAVARWFSADDIVK